MLRTARLRIIPLLLFGLANVSAYAQSSDESTSLKSPPPFGKEVKNVPIDMKKVTIEYQFDPIKKKATATSIIEFAMTEEGRPFFDLLPGVSRLVVNGKVQKTSQLKTIRDPDRVTTFRVLDEVLKPGKSHEIIVDFDISHEVTFSRGSARSGFFMSDLTNRRFFEQYGPANMEYDQVEYLFHVTVIGDTAHEIFTNGDLVVTGENQWTIQFPDYFTASSIYFHLTDKDRYKVQKFTYSGVDETIPVTVYSSSSSNVSRAVTDTKKYMKSFEEKFGSFAHDKLVIYIAGRGGMEYCGATMTSLGALNHELTHSWFARGVMPANGNAGWIDEAIASWQDDGFAPARSGPNRSPVNLGGFSPYRRHTTNAAYSKGEQLIQELDFVFRNEGGMLPIIRDFYGKYRRSTILVSDFQDHIEEYTGEDMTAIFDRYVYGKSYVNGKLTIQPEDLSNSGQRDGHPRPYTREELKRLQ